MTENIVVNPNHPLAGIVLSALRDGRRQHEGTPQMLSRAVRAVLDADPTMAIGDAYEVVNRLWVR